MATVKKVIVFGGTGGTGRYILQQAVDKGLEVTAFVRTPSKLGEELRAKIAVVQGDILNQDLVGDAIEGHDAVLSALGNIATTKPQFTMSKGMRNIISGMKKHNVKTLVVIGGALSLPGYWVPWFAKEAIADHKRQWKILDEEKQDIDWISVNPPFIKASSKINQYILAVDYVDGRFRVNTGEIADFMLKCLEEKELFDRYRHCRVGISSGPAYITTIQLKILAAVIVMIFVWMILHNFF